MTADIDEILSVIKTNEEIARKLFEIELKILTIKNYRGLFEELLILIEDKFQVPHVWLSLVDSSKLSRYVSDLDSSSFLKRRVNILPRKILWDLLGRSGEPILANKNLSGYYKLLPQKQKYLIKSLAIAPVALDGNFIGSLNMGDFSEARFQPEMDTFFLSQLVVKVSICLSNVTAHEELKRLASRDPLTNLLNRREMELALVQEFNRLARYGQPLALLFVDCDGFKQVNDYHGHDCGDSVLQYLAHHMRDLIRPSDLIFRFAGDEFVIVLPHQTLREAAIVAKRLQHYLHNHPMEFGNHLIPISISIGISSTEEAEINDPSSLIRRADQRLYAIKNQPLEAI